MLPLATRLNWVAATEEMVRLAQARTCPVEKSCHQTRRNGSIALIGRLVADLVTGRRGMPESMKQFKKPVLRGLKFPWLSGFCCLTLNVLSEAESGRR